MTTEAHDKFKGNIPSQDATLIERLFNGGALLPISPPVAPTDADTLKRDQGYIAPAYRPSCWNCRHMWLMHQHADRCRLGGFTVEMDGWCPQHKFTEMPS